MAPLDALERYLWYLTVIGYLVLVLRIWKSDLRHIYRFFFYYLIFRAVRALALAYQPPDTNLYALIWMGTQPILWFFYIVVVLELYTLVLQNYRGIATLGRWALLVALIVSLAFSLLTLAPDLSNAAEQFPKIRTFTVIDRGVVSSLVIFLLLIAGFLVWYPVPLSRNVVVHCIAYAIYFLSTTLVLLVRNLNGSGVTQTVNIFLSGITVAWLTVCIVFLNRQGEVKTVTVRRHWVPAEEQQLVEQLSAINSTLLRAARK